MLFLLSIIIFLILIIMPSVIADTLEDRRIKKNHRERWKQTKMNNYRTHITCNDIIISKTFPSITCAEALNKAIDYSLEEAGDFPNVVLIKRDVIYL